jgi:hypothetical protein
MNLEEKKVKRGRGRPRKIKVEETNVESTSIESSKISKVEKVEKVEVKIKSSKEVKSKNKTKDDDISTETETEIKDNDKDKDTSNETKIESPNEKLARIILEVNSEKEGVIVLSDGKTYTKVSQRIKKTREIFGFDLKIISIIKEVTKEHAHCEAQIWIKSDADWELVQTANAFEEKYTSHINQTSYVECAETSAIGRALGFLGIFGNEFASVDEVTNAILGQGNTKEQKKATKISSPVKNTKKEDPATEVQIKEIRTFINSNKSFTEKNILNEQLGVDGKQATKVEDLTKKSADTIINIIKTSSSDDPI